MQGKSNSVVIESMSVAEEKLTVKVENNTLQMYLEGAKIFTKTEKRDWDKGRKAIYKGTIVKATVTFKSIKDLSLKGEENFSFTNGFNTSELNAHIYGASTLLFKEIDVADFKAVIYGEAQLKIEKGHVQNQKYTVYGEAEIDAEKMTSKVTKITAYGEAKLNVNVSETLKVSSFGAASIFYKGNPKVQKGINFGETTISSIN